MASNQNTHADGIQNVTTTIEKCSLENGRELQWLIRNFDVIHSSSMKVINQNFGPLNGKVLIKLDLTKLDDGAYELGVRVHPSNNVMWMNFQFTLHGVNNNTDFSINGDARNVQNNRLTHKLNIPPQSTLKITFKPEILLSVSDVIVGPPMENMQFGDEPTQNAQLPPTNDNNQWVAGLPAIIQQIINQRIAEGQHWMEFFRSYPTEFQQMQRSLVSILTNSELLRESPRMVQNLVAELKNNPDYVAVNQRIRDVLAGMHRESQPTPGQTPQQNTEAPQPTTNEQNIFAAFPPLMQSAQELLQQQAPTQEQLQSTLETVQNVFESIRSNPVAAAYIDRYQTEFAGLQQQFQQMVDQYSTTQQPSTEQTQPSEQPTGQAEPIIEINANIEAPQVNATVEETVLEPAHGMPSVSQRLSVSPNTDWTFLFTAKGTSGYIRHVKSMGQQVPYHRNFCRPQTWELPNGAMFNVELVHALHPEAPFICLFDYEHTSDMAFVQTLIDGNGQEIHKIDSFSDSYRGFTCDMLLKSAEVDDCIRIKIEAIPNMD